VRTDYKITVRGTMSAVGTVAQPIQITTNTAFQTGYGVQIADSGFADLRFVRFSRFGSALDVPCCGNARYTVDDCVFETNSVAISGYTGLACAVVVCRLSCSLASACVARGRLHHIDPALSL
jgi:hypothetical protein